MKKSLNFRPAAPDELQVDLDRPRARIPKRLLRLVSEHVQIKSIKYSKSKSGNTHVTIKLKQTITQHDEMTATCFCGAFFYGSGRLHQHRCISIQERLFLQAALGSDPVRELLSWGRARNGCPYPTLFFEEKK